LEKKTAFNKKTLSISKLDLNSSKKLVKCYISVMYFNGAKTWTLRKVGHECITVTLRLGFMRF